MARPDDTASAKAAPLARFAKSDASGGIMLLLATALTLILSNTILSQAYSGVLATKISIAVGAFSIDKPLLLWINDELMAIFFFLVGLELKREILEGELSDPSPPFSQGVRASRRSNG